MAKPATEFYSFTLLLGGSQLNQTKLTGVPAAEVVMLQAIHGADAIKDIRIAKKGEERQIPANVLEEAGLPQDHGWSNKATRAYLRNRFAAKASVSEEADRVARVFGPELTPVPTRIDIVVDESAALAEERKEAALRAKIQTEMYDEIKAKVLADVDVVKSGNAAAAVQSASAAKKQALEMLGENA